MLIAAGALVTIGSVLGLAGVGLTGVAIIAAPSTAAASGKRDLRSSDRRLTRIGRGRGRPARRRWAFRQSTAQQPQGRRISTRSDMAIGPVQLIVLGFPHPDFHGAIIGELERLRASDSVRIIDSLAVHKDADGEIEVANLSNLSHVEAAEFGSAVGALIGLGIDGEEGMTSGAEAGARAAADGIHMFSDSDAWDVLEQIPDGSAAAVILLEHTWAIPLRDAVAEAGGFRIDDGFISPLDLIGLGLVSGEEAKRLHDFETASAPTF
jgi:uncharacterized membrane protein